jgi:Metal-dependent hydrolases of the beta-lactamase superfamily I
MKFCSLFSGSSGNCIFVSSNETKVLIDAGLSGKTVESALCSIGETGKDIDAILVTHEHSDHIKGVGILSRKYDIPVFATLKTWEAIGTSIGAIKEHNLKTIDGDVINIKDLDIIRYTTSHDAADPSGYSLSCSGKKISITTDLGYFSDAIRDQIMDSNVILLESNHDIEMLKFGPYPYYLKRRILGSEGHLSNDACAQAIIKIANGNKKNIILGHLSNTNNYPDLAYKTVYNALMDAGIDMKSEINIAVAKRSEPSNYIEI